MMTDRQVCEWYLMKYQKPTNVEREIQSWEAVLAEQEKAEAEKSLAQRKQEYWELCRYHGIKDELIQAEWDKFQRGET